MFKIIEIALALYGLKALVKDFLKIDLLPNIGNSPRPAISPNLQKNIETFLIWNNTKANLPIFQQIARQIQYPAPQNKKEVEKMVLALVNDCKTLLRLKIAVATLNKDR